MIWNWFLWFIFIIVFKNLVGECFIIWFEQIKFNLIDFKDLEIKEPKLKIKQMFSLFYLLLKLFYLSPFNAFGAQLRIHFNFQVQNTGKRRQTWSWWFSSDGQNPLHWQYHMNLKALSLHSWFSCWKYLLFESDLKQTIYPWTSIPTGNRLISFRIQKLDDDTRVETVYRQDKPPRVFNVIPTTTL